MDSKNEIREELFKALRASIMVGEFITRLAAESLSDEDMRGLIDDINDVAFREGGIRVNAAVISPNQELKKLN
jgi:hypothetical protein